MKSTLLSIALIALALTPASARQNAKPGRTEAGLAKLAPADRFQQACDIELMERLRHESRPYKPDSVIAYALGDPHVTGDTLKGDGGAFRSGGIWYQYSFTCEATPDRMKVISLEYRVGEAVPRDEWDSHGLSIH
ncbi:DUF930 domain-containing protein [Labrys sp. ZIDIC5]|uniref:DUF930 domain-containing protein n=1 Tax=Labrys sedimenti TaxID=3106036 RepID=UPI002ACAC850|nr:DUF930 domain-containing protein [Labrys sp. ZIDIC5]MDZ5448222.1 DUF930 domain-containing protein [Labrys sp. ZIDIC5]